MKKMLFELLACPLLCSAGIKWDQVALENRLYEEGLCPVDDMNVLSEDDYKPDWQKDVLKEYGAFFLQGGWSTNDFVNGLMFATTGHLYSATWPSKRDEIISSVAFSVLSRVNLPQVKMFIRQLCTNDVKTILGAGIAGVYRYSQFESDVFDYMRSVCVKTNVYERWVGTIAVDMEMCFVERPAYYNSSATNNFARYQYFVLKHATANLGSVDAQIADFIPAYSNSVQRLKAMQYVSNTATNAAMVRWARRQVDRLSAMPTNELNNVSWLEE